MEIKKFENAPNPQTTTPPKKTNQPHHQTTKRPNDQTTKQKKAPRDSMYQAEPKIFCLQKLICGDPMP